MNLAICLYLAFQLPDQLNHHREEFLNPPEHHQLNLHMYTENFSGVPSTSVIDIMHLLPDCNSIVPFTIL